MLFGITGAHRSGKTTLAAKIAEELDIEFYATSTSEVARTMGFDAVGPMTLSQRIALQRGLLANHLDEINRRSRPLITDRTPLDFLGYLTCEFDMQSHHKLCEKELLEAEVLMLDCINATRLNYDYLFYLSPLPNYIVETGKPAANKVYQRHFDLTLLGAIAQLRNTVNSAQIFETDFEKRRDFVHDAIVDRLNFLERERRTAVYLS